MQQIEYRKAITNIQDLRGGRLDQPTINKVDASIKLILEVMARAEIIIFQNGTLKPLKWYNVQTIFKLANLFYYFIQNIVKIWTK
jgi:hypothetical protein